MSIRRILGMLVFSLAALAGVCAAAAVPTAPPASLQSAIAQAIQSNQSDHAHSLLESALKKYPDWREGWWDLGSLAYEQDNYLEGRLAFQRLAQLDPKSGAPWVMLGLCDFELRDFGMSLLHIEKGRALGFPKNPQMSDASRYHQALDLIMIDEYAQAGYLLDSFARENHPSPDIYLAEGLAAMHIPAIGPTFRHVVSPTRYNLVLQVGKAKYLAASHEITQARQIDEKLIAGNPTIPWLHYAYGELLSNWAGLPDAIQQFKEELAVNPGNESAMVRIAYLDLNLEQYKEALPYARRAVALASGSFVAHFVLGQILVAQGDLTGGTHQLEISRDLQPGSSQVRYALAQAYLRQHRRKDALREQRAFKRLRPIENSLIQKGTLPASVFEPAARGRIGHNGNLGRN